MSTLTHIGTGITVVGTLRAGEDLTIAGRVQGRVEAEGAVIVEAGAILEADVRARELIVRGVVVGDITVVDTLEVTANGQVLGNVTGRRIHLRPGGRIQGEVATAVEVQGFVYPDRVAVSGARRGPGSGAPGASTGLTSRALAPTLPARGASDSPFASRSGSTREGARSWLTEQASEAAATEEGRRFTPHFDVSLAEEAKAEPPGEGI